MSDLNAIKYLDLNGLNVLWGKISDTYLRQTAAAETYATKDALAADVASLSGRIDSIQAGGVDVSKIVDGKTIVAKDGKLSTSIALVKDTENSLIKLVDSVSGTISEFSYADFLLDGMLDSVALVVVPTDEAATDGRGAGTYLKFTFNTASGKNPIYVNVTDLVNFTGSDYIEVVDGKMTLKTADLVDYLKTDDALGITSIITRLGGLDDSITAINSTLDTINATLGTLTTDVDGVKTTVADHTTRLDGIDAVLATVPTVAITEDEIKNLV